MSDYDICRNCTSRVVRERTDDPWFHDESGQERCAPELGEQSEFAQPRSGEAPA